MPVRLGVGVVTYNRREIVLETVDRVLAHTNEPFAFVVADDGSEDGTADHLRDNNIVVASGSNMGIAWNKNRALFYLFAIQRCEVAILLEDDSQPDRDGWELAWLEGARAWGHVNIAGHWFRDSFLCGAGTAERPFESIDVSAQCSAYTREAILYGGYMDSRFKGYGFEHVEHTARLMRAGYGGEYRTVAGVHRAVHFLIEGNVAVKHPPSHGIPEDISRNEKLCHQLLHDQSYRAPWRDQSEMRQFRAEMNSAAGLS
jgi:glycosyltransferase involved in cell wall biosynthesis